MTTVERLLGFIASLIAIIVFAASIYQSVGPEDIAPQLPAMSFSIRLLIWLVLFVAIAAGGAFPSTSLAEMGAGIPVIAIVAIVGASAWTAAFLTMVLVSPQLPPNPTRDEETIFFGTGFACWVTYTLTFGYFTSTFARDKVDIVESPGWFGPRRSAVSRLKFDETAIMTLNGLICGLVTAALYAQTWMNATGKHL
ncbi:MAG: hypothetical protein JNK07_06320 [Alphaproteobacteria bacterium]|nr:hypothetical protein [Alphaproteobacteria bacterium]